MLGGNISPKCEYCEFSTPTNDGDTVLCPKKGALCQKIGAVKKYKYDIFKREPKLHPTAPEFLQKAILRFNITAVRETKAVLGRLFFSIKKRIYT